MPSSDDREKVKAILIETVTALCKNSLKYQDELTVEGLLGVTLDSQEIFLVNIKKQIKRNTMKLHCPKVKEIPPDKMPALLIEALTLLCKNRLDYRVELTIEGLLGITLDHEKVFLVNIDERIERPITNIQSHIAKSIPVLLPGGEIFLEQLKGNLHTQENIGDRVSHTKPPNNTPVGKQALSKPRKRPLPGGNNEEAEGEPTAKKRMPRDPSREDSTVKVADGKFNNVITDKPARYLDK